jgi:hypothetical protein
MAIVAGFDVHRAQITFDALDVETGEVTRGRIDSTPAAVGRWVARPRMWCLGHLRARDERQGSRAERDVPVITRATTGAGFKPREPAARR